MRLKLVGKLVQRISGLRKRNGQVWQGAGGDETSRRRPRSPRAPRWRALLANLVKRRAAVWTRCSGSGRGARVRTDPHGWAGLARPFAPSGELVRSFVGGAGAVGLAGGPGAVLSTRARLAASCPRRGELAGPRAPGKAARACSTATPRTTRAGTWAVPISGGLRHDHLARPEARHDTKYFGPCRHDTNMRAVPCLRSWHDGLYGPARILGRAWAGTA